MSKAIDELHKDITSLCLKNNTPNQKASSLTKEIEILKNKDEQSKLNIEILKGNEKIHAQSNDLDSAVLKFTVTILDLMLGDKSQLYTSSGIGYEETMKLFS